MAAEADGKPHMTSTTDLPVEEGYEPAGSDAAHGRSVGAMLRAAARLRALESALDKRGRGVPTYTVPEAAALLSISPEALYRLVRADAFPAVRVGQKYSVPAAAVSDLLEFGTSLEITDWASQWKERHRSVTGGAA
ncbi:helix-turn-helix domain-containing protein [Kribbella sp. NPDC048915]|uniref:helix-turn-helix domain-containing protein n=1 Tax=Kribbella sp. NPDC048915 TaxID=3155148 RepID=UPI0033D5187D